MGAPLSQETEFSEFPRLYADYQLVENGRGSKAQAWPASELIHQVPSCLQELKHLFAVELVLKHSNLDEPVVIQADVSDVAVGAVLLQKNAKRELQPCTYMFCKLSDTEGH